ncbi:toxin-antitoxin system YwqK family antitoxin [Paenibacillus arenosi]|uniref:Toxin-antitoxin system YwqK family antitoxin n=1 Tax=Paenibacillus arenosi TaxID=2774142 RepID=A0ABR9AXC4_9BACL|nr:hypothetical protein [Paenibacillus arenosi]MBD8498789.1 hypothetical protein [Paenibacillus arenosi]
MENDIYTLEYIRNNGSDFEDLWFTSCSDEIIDNPEDEGGKPFTGLTYELYENGCLRYFCFYKNGFKEGMFREYYRSGKLKSEEVMKYGQTIGKRTIWYESGKIKSVSEHEQGIELSYNEWDEFNKLILSRQLPKIN